MDLQHPSQPYLLFSLLSVVWEKQKNTKSLRTHTKMYGKLVENRLSGQEPEIPLLQIFVVANFVWNFFLYKVKLSHSQLVPLFTHHQINTSAHATNVLQQFPCAYILQVWFVKLASLSGSFQSHYPSVPCPIDLGKQGLCYKNEFDTSVSQR
jgi:hypothetical protein